MLQPTPKRPPGPGSTWGGVAIVLILCATAVAITWILS